MIERLAGLVRSADDAVSLAAVAPARRGTHQIAAQLARPNLGPLAIAIDHRMADAVLGSLQPEPAGDLIWRPAHRKVVVDMIPQRVQALGPRASPTARECNAVRRGGLVASLR